MPQLIYLKGHFEAATKSPLDAAILEHEPPSIVADEKVDESPFGSGGLVGTRARHRQSAHRSDEPHLFIPAGSRPPTLRPVLREGPAS